MKEFLINRKWLWIICAVLLVSLSYVDSVHAQRGKVSPTMDIPDAIQDNNLELITEDSCVVINILHSYILPELSKGLWQDIDTTRKYIYQAMAIAERINYIQGKNDLRRCLGSAYTAKGPQDSAQFYLRYSIKQMEELQDTSRMTFFLIQYGRSCWLSSKFDSAIFVTEKAAHLALAIRDSASYLDCVSILPRYYMESGNYVNAAKWSLQNMELATQYKDTFNIVFNARYLAKVYGTMGLNEREMNAASTALKYGENSNYIYTNFHAYLAISEAYLHLQQYDSAVIYARKNISLFYGGGQNLSHLTLAAVFRDQGLMDSAFLHIQNFIDATIKFKLHMWPEPYFILGSCEFKQGKFQKAAQSFLKAEAELQPQDRLIFRNIYRSLAECFDTLQQPQKALKYLNQYMELEDSMKFSQKAFAIAMLESEKETEYMQSQIKWLTQNNELQNTLASKERTQKKLVYASFPLLFCIAIIGFVRYRKQREEKSKQALLKERLRISRELHDEVGATLSGIAMYSHVAKDQLKQERHVEASSSLSFMQKSAGEMVNKLSDIVWLINPEQDTILEIIGRLGEYGKQMAGAKNMQMKLDVPSELTSIHIPLEARRNIYLICKEAINNAVKYSHGRCVELQVRMEGTQLSFLVMDDGNGFDMSTIKPGNGLINMRNRAEEIGAKYHMESFPYKGTSVEIHYKLIH